MPAKTPTLVSKADGTAAGFRSPEQDEVDRKRAELEHLRETLADVELELATLRADLITFERRYMDTVGRRYAKLDELEARLAESTARSHPKNPSARQKAESSRARARASAEAIGDADHEHSAREFKPSEELKSLYRQAARELHPDLTTDERDRPRREKAMAELNKAYEDCDIERIRRILDEWRSSPEHVQGDDTAAQLVRVIREIAQVRKRLAAIKGEIEELARGELSRLKKQVEEAAARGQNLLAEIARKLDARIAATSAKLQQASKTGAAP